MTKGVEVVWELTDNWGRTIVKSSIMNYKIAFPLTDTNTRILFKILLFYFRCCFCPIFRFHKKVENIYLKKKGFQGT